MASGIEAEMARFEEEVLGSDAGHNSESRGSGNVPELPPPPFMQKMNPPQQFERNERYNPDHFYNGPGPMNTMHGPGPMQGPPPMMGGPRPMPGHGPDMMMGPGPMMHGPGPMLGPNAQMMGPGMGPLGPDISSPAVYSAPAQIMKPPQITKRKLKDDESGASSIQESAKFGSADAGASQVASTTQTSNPALSGMPPMNYTSSFGPPGLTRPNLGRPQQPPTQFSQATAASGYDTAKLLKRKKYIRTAAGQSWEDPSLQEWDPNDYRLFCGDLGNEVTDDILARVFNKYTSFQKARVVREKNSKKSKGYGFVSFKDPNDFIRAMREMNGKYVGNRPIKLRKSNWKDRNIEVVRKKLKEKKKLGYKV